MSELIRQAIETKLRADAQELKQHGYGITVDEAGEIKVTAVKMLPAPASPTDKVINLTPQESASLAGLGQAAAATSSITKKSRGGRPRAAGAVKLCKEAGCDRKVVAREMCSKHYSKWLYDSKK